MVMIMGRDANIVRLGPEAPHSATRLSVGLSDVSLVSSLDCSPPGECLHVRRRA
jgi:hypothetical protein